MVGFKKILNKRVTRKEFLILAAMFIYSVSGLKNITATFKNIEEPIEKGFGKGPYGGTK